MTKIEKLKNVDLKDGKILSLIIDQQNLLVEELKLLIDIVNETNGRQKQAIKHLAEVADTTKIVNSILEGI